MNRSLSRLCVGLVVGVFAESALAQPVLFHGLPVPGSDSLDRDIDANADGFIRGRELVPDFGLIHDVETHRVTNHPVEGSVDEPREQPPLRGSRSDEGPRDQEQPRGNHPETHLSPPRFSPPFGGPVPPFGPLERRPQPFGPGVPPIGPIAHPEPPGRGPGGPASMKMADILFVLLDLNRDGHLSRDEFQRLARVLEGNVPHVSPGGDHRPPVIGAHGPDRMAQHRGRAHRPDPGPRPPIQQRLQHQRRPGPDSEKGREGLHEDEKKRPQRPDKSVDRSEHRKESDSPRGRGRENKPETDSSDDKDSRDESRRNIEKPESRVRDEDDIRAEWNPRFERESTEIVEPILETDWI